MNEKNAGPDRMDLLNLSFLESLPRIRSVSIRDHAVTEIRSLQAYLYLVKNGRRRGT